jgi:hypothetical protein
LNNVAVATQHLSLFSLDFHWLSCDSCFGVSFLKI